MTQECTCFLLCCLRVVDSALPTFVSSWPWFPRKLRTYSCLMGFSTLCAPCLVLSTISCIVNQLFTNFTNSWKSSYWSFDDQSKLSKIRVVRACGDSFFSASTAASPSGMVSKVVVVVTGIESRSTGNWSRSLGLWHDQGGSYVPATWCTQRMGDGIIWLVYIGVKGSKTGH